MAHHVLFSINDSGEKNLLQGQSQSITKELFPPGETTSRLDQKVAVLSREMIDDFPASDPRWAESVPQG